MNKTLDIKVLYEDGDIVAIQKPSGLMVHPDGRSSEATLVDWVHEHFPSMTGVGEPLVLSSGVTVERPGIVHRLDKDTTGVLLLAKNQEAFESLKRQFKERQVAKRYIAFVYGEMPEAQGVIDRPIGKSRKDFRLWSAQRGAKGAMREATTEFRVLGVSGGYSVVSAEPRTGRTHQIRVHFKAVNHPVVCDPLYAPKRPCALGFTRTALHAYSVTVARASGAPLTVIAPLPPDFRAALAELRLSGVADAEGRMVQ